MVYKPITLTALINLPNSENSSGSGIFDSSDLTHIYAEDLNTLRASLQQTAFGIKTETINAKDIDCTSLTVSGNVTVGIGGLSIGKLDLTGSSDSKITISNDINLEPGRLFAGIDPSAHQHLGGSSDAPRVPVSSIVGAGFSNWSVHDHFGDGSAQLSEGSIADDALTISKFNSGVLGTSFTQVFPGNEGKRISDALKQGIDPTVSVLPVFSQFISPWEMGSLSKDGNDNDVRSGRRGFPVNSGTTDNFKFDDKDLVGGNTGQGTLALYANPLNPGGPTNIKYVGARLTNPGGNGPQSLNGLGGRFQVVLPPYLYGRTFKVQFIFGVDDTFGGTTPDLRLQYTETLLPISGGPLTQVSEAFRNQYPCDGDALTTLTCSQNGTTSEKTFSAPATKGAPTVGTVIGFDPTATGSTQWPQNSGGFVNQFTGDVEEDTARPWLYGVRFTSADTFTNTRFYILGACVTFNPYEDLEA